jgi:hypothetical protein
VDTIEVVRRLRITVVCGVIAFALASAVPSQRATTERPVVTLSCSAPRDEEERLRCAALERQILDATVFIRFTLYCGDGSHVALIPSHATIVDSRTLLTHDHYYPLSDPTCVVASLEVETASGKRLAQIEEKAALDDLAQQLRPGSSGSSQTRSVRFPTPLFTPVPTLAFEVTDRASSPATFVYSGELAEINWESFPKATRVQWVRPIALERRGKALGILVDTPIEIGASGGGVFRVTPGGLVHVGNVWGPWQEDGTSIVALNQ